jgi:phosphate transport system permease protein
MNNSTNNNVSPGGSPGRPSGSSVGAGAGARKGRTIDVVQASLKRRYAAERRFRLAGAGAVLLGLGFVAMLFVSIIGQGYTAFQQTYIQLPVYFDPEVVDPDGDFARDRAQGSPAQAEIDERLLGVNFLALGRAALKAEFPGVGGRTDTRALNSLLSPGAPLQLREMLARDPSLVGAERSVWLLADDDVDMFMKGRSTAVQRLDVGGTATLAAADGGPLGELPASGDRVRVESTVADFAPLLAGVRDFLSRQADRARREIARVERALEANAAERERLLQALADAEGAKPITGADAAGTDSVARLELQLGALDVRRTDLEGQLRAESERLAALQARMADDDGDNELTDDMPSFLVRLNDGLIKADSVSGSRIDGTVFLPPASLEPAGAEHWRIIELTTPENGRRLKDRQVAWVLHLKHEGQIKKRFNTIFFTHGTSREPELAGIAGALMGSFYALVLTLLFSFPIGVGAAVYLEEFAPKNRITDLIEVNINNLAAVPSIVFGLLGLAVFINFFGVPRSTPLVAAMVLTLMTLPTIIIASRAALKSVPPSIREAALGVGASPLQTQIHHVLPLALPGMLTGTIIGMAQALGESAPLLMIGMIAFIVDVPAGFTDPATVLPVQIFLWADSPERGFVERTSAAIMVLLAFLVLMNLAAVLLRRRFERRW